MKPTPKIGPWITADLEAFNWGTESPPENFHGRPLEEIVQASGDAWLGVALSAGYLPDLGDVWTALRAHQAITLEEIGALRVEGSEDDARLKAAEASLMLRVLLRGLERYVFEVESLHVSLCPDPDSKESRLAAWRRQRALLRRDLLDDELRRNVGLPR